MPDGNGSAVIVTPYQGDALAARGPTSTAVLIAFEHAGAIHPEDHDGGSNHGRRVRTAAEELVQEDGTGL